MQFYYDKEGNEISYYKAELRGVIFVAKMSEDDEDHDIEISYNPMHSHVPEINEMVSEVYDIITGDVEKYNIKKREYLSILKSFGI